MFSKERIRHNARYKALKVVRAGMNGPSPGGLNRAWRGRRERLSPAAAADVVPLVHFCFRKKSLSSLGKGTQLARCTSGELESSLQHVVHRGSKAHPQDEPGHCSHLTSQLVPAFRRSGQTRTVHHAPESSLMRAVARRHWRANNLSRAYLDARASACGSHASVRLPSTP